MSRLRSSIGLVWLGLVWLGLVWFGHISTILGYLMLNPLYTYILNIYDLQTHFVDTFFNEPELFFLHIVKWFQVLLSNTNSSVCTQLNVFNHSK